MVQSWRYRTSKLVGTEWDITPATASFEWDDVSQTWVNANLIFGSLSRMLLHLIFQKPVVGLGGIMIMLNVHNRFHLKHKMFI